MSYFSSAHIITYLKTIMYKLFMKVYMILTKVLYKHANGHRTL